ncbi:MAG TPA: hypothetical protein VGH89_08790 [Pseudonocardia sp.]|jgi:hypothetical protein
MTDCTAELRAELGKDLDVLDSLTQDEQAELLEMVRQARAGQHQALDGALNQVLKHLPRLVRGPARKILFG